MHGTPSQTQGFTLEHYSTPSCCMPACCWVQKVSSAEPQAGKLPHTLNVNVKPIVHCSLRPAKKLVSSRLQTSATSSLAFSTQHVGDMPE